MVLAIILGVVITVAAIISLGREQRFLKGNRIVPNFHGLPADKDLCPICKTPKEKEWAYCDKCNWALEGEEEFEG